MEDLKEKIVKNGFLYNQIAKNEGGYVYSQAYKNGQIVAYEVFKKIIKPPKIYEIKGKVFNTVERVKFPANEDFGKSAWTCNTKGKALEILENFIR